MYKILLILLILAGFGCKNSDSKNNISEGSAYRFHSEPQLIYHVFQLQKGWGYSVYRKGKLYIRQEIMPVLPGNIPFKSETDARKVAELVLKKLKSGESPQVTFQELQHLRVVN